MPRSARTPSGARLRTPARLRAARDSSASQSSSRRASPRVVVDQHEVRLGAAVQVDRGQAVDLAVGRGGADHRALARIEGQDGLRVERDAHPLSQPPHRRGVRRARQTQAHPHPGGQRMVVEEVFGHGVVEGSSSA